MLSRGGRLIGVYLLYHTHLKTGGGSVIGLTKRTSQESDCCPILQNVPRIYVNINMSVLSIKEAEVNLNVHVRVSIVKTV